MKLIEIKIAISELKNTPGGINSRLDTAEVEDIKQSHKTIQHEIKEKRYYGGKEQGTFLEQGTVI